MKKVFIIAEAGVNHNGSLEIGKKLIDIASKAKADYVKFQLYKSEKLVQENTKLAPYQKKNLKLQLTQKKMLKKYELNFNMLKKLILYSRKKKIKFLCTPFDIESLYTLKKLKIRSFKISSPDLDNFTLLSKLKNSVDKIFLSTGMSTLNDIENTLNYLKRIKVSSKKLYLLHCTSDYPAQKEELNLNAIKLLKEKFRVNIGYSDHSEGNLASIVATTLGASVIEKHITLNKKMSGPDHSSSMSGTEFIEFVKAIRNTKIVLGDKKKVVTKMEKKNFKTVKRSVFLNKDVKKGSKFRIEDFICLRPRKKLSSINWSKVLDKKAKKNLKKGTFINI